MGISWFIFLLPTCFAVFYKTEDIFSGVRFSKTVEFENLNLTVANSASSKSKERIKNQSIVDKRNENGHFKLDLIMAGDHSLFEAFLELHGSAHDDAYFAVQTYLEAVFNQLETIYSKILFFGKHFIKLKLIGTLVIENAQDCPLKTASLLFNPVDNDTFNDENLSTSWSIDTTRLLMALGSWRALHEDLLPKHDHVVVVTKFDLLSSTGDAATQGMSFVGKMCDSHESVSVVEDVGALTTSVIAAHEIGHNLGSFHDGDLTNDCNPASNYLMSPWASTSAVTAIFNNGFKLSRCSQESIEKFLRSPESICLTAEPGSEPEKRVLPRTSQRRPLWSGEQFGLSKQCQIAFAPHYGDCNQRIYKEINPDPCRRLWCKNRLQNRFLPCETKSYLPLMDGTECGKGKWCLSGSCVVNQFYDPGSECQDLNDAYCREKYPPSVMKVFCVRKSFAAICCRQCQKYNNYIWEKYRKVEQSFKKVKIPTRKILPGPDLSSNSTDLF